MSYEDVITGICDAINVMKHRNAKWIFTKIEWEIRFVRNKTRGNGNSSIKILLEHRSNGKCIEFSSGS